MLENYLVENYNLDHLIFTKPKKYGEYMISKIRYPTEDITDDIEPNTSSMVRGEELLELLQLIVRFCITHVHPYPGMPPTPVTVDGLSSDELLSNMFNAYQKVLNSNIRLN